jgi:hypothetical protein
MARPFHDPVRRSEITWTQVWAAVRAREGGCRSCGSWSIRRSALRTPILLKVAGLRLFRCQDCGGLFPLRCRFIA